MARVLKTRTDFLSVSTDIKISELKNYLETLGNQLEIIASDYDHQVDEQAQRIDDEKSRDEFYEFSGEQHFNYTETFPRILLNSFHVMAYSLLESEIISLANLVGRKQSQIFEVSDFGGRNYLGSASRYINKLTNIKVQDFRSWNSIDDGRHLRNTVVHSNGIITNQHIFDLARSHDFIDSSTIDFASLRTIERLSITYEYCQSFLSTLKGFFSELYSELATGDFL